MTKIFLPIGGISQCSPSVLNNECGETALIFWGSFTATCVDESLLFNAAAPRTGEGLPGCLCPFSRGSLCAGQGCGGGAGLQHWVASMLTRGTPVFMTFVSVDPDF